ncbi:hypothetical protein BDF20DRAFT_839105 [Mycotypha africana]|uniref:uncharacterized protein n=1 Tax=Mycotypha africana TaxID=64632 RepID=UPI002300A46C|nr:uncharacterized protein BDF20DRAFT_839105 [Mycotypha africana]KAI8969158.1 hypothetical protein BDF20DRAFT_839105 [Mycotypha africana]
MVTVQLEAGNQCPSSHIEKHELSTHTTDIRPSKPLALRLFDSSQLKVLLLEDINESAIASFKKCGYQISNRFLLIPQVEVYKDTLTRDKLIEKICDVHIIGIRSKTVLTAEVLNHATKLLAIGCFCVSIDQVDLQAAAERGIAVFNSPFKNSRSVAELAIGGIIMLARQLGDRIREMHSGIWNKTSRNCHEIRGKTLGIIGYGHIGSQLSVLAEALGMSVCFYDILPIMPLGQAKPVDNLGELLEISDFVTIHVPENQSTRDMIGEQEIRKMKQGAFLINMAGGSVVQLPALVKALQRRHLGGAYLDVFSKQPTLNGPYFDYYPELMSCPNLILTPYIGGSTEEAQRMIGHEVSHVLIKYVNDGSSLNSVNFPEIALRPISETDKGIIRLLHVYQKDPSVLKEINRILAAHNIEKQFSNTKGNISYVMADIANVTDIRTLYDAVSVTSTNIRTRILF